MAFFGKLTLCVSARQAVAAYWQGGRGATPAACQVFANDEEGIDAFAEFVKPLGRTLATVAADTVEEDYRHDTLPHATGSDRAALIDRKIRQYYRSTRFVAASQRERTTGKRRDDRYLFSALTNPGLIDPWLNQLTRAGLPIAGVYLSSRLTAPLLAKLGISVPRALIATPHSSGLRLTFHRDGLFITSRLTRSVPAEATEAARFLGDEITNTRLYLATLNLDGDETLETVIIDPRDELAAAAAALPADGLECRVIGRAVLLQKLGLAPRELDLAPETMYLRLLAEHAPEDNLAPASITATHRLLQRQRSLYLAAAGVASAGLVWAGVNLWREWDSSSEAADMAKRTAAVQGQYKEITRTFPAAPTTSDNLIRAVNIHQSVLRSARTPRAFMQTVSRAIQQSPEVFVQEISWGQGAAPAPANAPATVAATRESGVLAGEIRPFHGDYRAAIAAINAVAGRLARDPSVAEVRIVKLPLNINPELALSGNTRDEADQAGAAEFRIAITLKPS
jgi:hypothetical protein